MKKRIKIPANTPQETILKLMKEGYEITFVFGTNICLI